MKISLEAYYHIICSVDSFLESKRKSYGPIKSCIPCIKYLAPSVVTEITNTPSKQIWIIGPINSFSAEHWKTSEKLIFRSNWNSALLRTCNMSLTIRLQAPGAGSKVSGWSQIVIRGPIREDYMSVMWKEQSWGETGSLFIPSWGWILGLAAGETSRALHQRSASKHFKLSFKL